MGRFGISRDEALVLLKNHITNENLIKHCLATEAIMRKLAERLGEDIEDWGLVGLMHDLDFEQTKNEPERHTLVTADILLQKGVAEDYVKAIIAHNERVPGSQRSSALEHLLSAAENITGLIVACALVMPDKKLKSVQGSSIKKRMKEKAFARNVDRSAIMECEQAGIPLEEFIELSLKAMQEINEQLGL